MTVLVQSCLEADFDAATNTCTHPTWTVQESGQLLPTLTIEQANEIGLACALLWGTAWVCKRLAKALEQG